MNASRHCSVEPELLRGWLDGRLAGDAADSVEAHIELCATCQAELDRITACNVPTLHAPIAARGPREQGDPPTRSASREGSGSSPVTEVDFVPELRGFDDFRPLGRGGMGAVFLARQVALDRLVAVKFIAGDHRHDSALITRMRYEARIIASLKHPQIVTIHDVIEDQGRPVLVLEYIEGGSLADLCERERPGPLFVCRLLELVAQGVHAAHERGVLHRDLKPSNILMEGYNPKITDFGLARMVDVQERLTSSGGLFGTPQYMAPEVIRLGSEAAGPASDVYALGVMLYEMIAGELPFPGGSTFDLLERIVRDDPPPLSSRVRELNPRLVRLCEAALRKDPELRPLSALEFAQRLHNIVEEEQHPESAADGASSSAEAVALAVKGDGGRASPAVPSRPRSSSSSEGSAGERHGWRNRRIIWAGLALLVVLSTAGAVYLSRLPREEADASVAETAGSIPAEPRGEEEHHAGSPPAASLVGTHWIGWFDFHPVDGQPDGDAELEIDEQTGNEFSGTYYSEQRNYAWKVDGVIDEDRISWKFVSAIHDNDASSVVGHTEVTGVFDRDVITAEWHQTGPTPSDADMQFGRRLGPEDAPTIPPES